MLRRPLALTLIVHHCLRAKLAHGISPAGQLDVRLQVGCRRVVLRSNLSQFELIFTASARASTRAAPPLVSVGDIWRASIGENVGFEINGKSERDRRSPDALDARADFDDIRPLDLRAKLEYELAMANWVWCGIGALFGSHGSTIRAFWQQTAKTELAM